MRRSNRSRRPKNKARTKYFPLKGGINLVDAPANMADGSLLAGVNHEQESSDGYKRIDGIERYDGQSSPSEQTYSILNFHDKAGAVSESDIITGATSGDTGEALIDEVILGTGVNLLFAVENIESTSWAKLNMTIGAATANPINGLVDADKLIPTVTLGAHRVTQQHIGSTGDYTLSAHVKAGGYDRCYLLVSSLAVFFIIAEFDLAAGTVLSGSSNAAIDDLGDGWYRISETGTSTSGTVIAGIEVRETFASVYSGDGVSGVYAWGVQLEFSAVLSPYLKYVGEYGYYVLINASGVFNEEEDLQVLAVTKSASIGEAITRGAPTTALDTTYLHDAIETQRAKITVAGLADGSGPIRGVNIYNGNVYAFRDNTAVTECLLWKSTTAGWVQQALGNRVLFTLGTAEMFDGETLTQTGTTSTINRVVVQSGTWSGNDAAGYLVIGTVTSGPYTAAIATTAGGSATLSGAEVANTIDPGGRFEFRNYNFFGSTTTQRMYGVSGVDYAFEWDGSTFVPIFTGNTVDTPSHIEINEAHLMLTFANGSLQNSSTGTPYVWAGGGAAEIGTGDDIVGLKKETGGAMGIICRNRTFMLFGKNTTELPWDLRTVSDESGGIEWTLQRLSGTRYLDDRGFVKLTAVEAYGDFKDAVYSQNIEPLVTEKKNSAISSVVMKGKNQIRTFFSDGTGLIHSFNDAKLSGFTQIRYTDTSGLTLLTECASNGEDSSGNELVVFGGDNGYVYQMDKGTSLDGGPVAATMTLSYSHLGYPSYDKQMKKVVVEAEGSTSILIEYIPAFDYASGRVPSGITYQQAFPGEIPLWNQVVWNQFNWAGEDFTRIEGNIDGVGRNISLQLSSIGTYEEPYTLYGLTYHYLLRKLVR